MNEKENKYSMIIDRIKMTSFLKLTVIWIDVDISVKEHLLNLNWR